MREIKFKMDHKTCALTVVIPGMGHKNKYHVIIKGHKGCWAKGMWGQLELGQEEKAGDRLSWMTS